MVRKYPVGAIEAWSQHVDRHGHKYFTRDGWIVCRDPDKDRERPWIVWDQKTHRLGNRFGTPVCFSNQYAAANAANKAMRSEVAS
jgi:hypothetical protein